MTISTAGTIAPLPKINGDIPVIDVKSGSLTEYGVQTLNAWYNSINGMNRIIPCNAAGQNVITLTPLTASPLIEKYNDYEVFAFTGADTSTGSVTATVVPRKGALATLKVYVSPGLVQAGAGDVVSTGLYLMVYNDALNGGVGGFVLK